MLGLPGPQSSPGFTLSDITEGSPGAPPPPGLGFHNWKTKALNDINMAGLFQLWSLYDCNVSPRRLGGLGVGREGEKETRQSSG